MRDKQPRIFLKNALATAMATAIGTAIPTTAQSDQYVWTSAVDGDVLFTMLDSAGGPLSNSSAAKGANPFQTQITGTLTYDTDTDTGSVTFSSFDFFSGSSPAIAQTVTVSKIPGGLDDGSGNLMLANMLFDWDGKNGIPVSIVWDAQGVFSEMDGSPASFTLVDDGVGTGNPGSADVSITSASAFTGGTGIPASDGTYTDATYGYLATGASPIATMEFNTTNTSTCVFGVDNNYADNTGGGCMSINPSADATAAVVVDAAPNTKEYAFGDGTGIGGSPMQDGPFQNFSANFDFTSMTLTSFDDTTPPTITLNAHVTPAGTDPITLTKDADTYTEPGASCVDAAPLNTNIGAATVGGDTVLNTIGTYTVTYNCSDNSGNAATQVTRTVNVIAAGNPIVTLTGNAAVTHECGTTYTDMGASCNDALDGPITGPGTPPQTFVFQPGSFDENTLGAQSVNWHCVDSDGNATDQGRSVTVEDNTDPTVDVYTAGGAGRIDMGVLILETNDDPAGMGAYSDPTATASDTCDASVTTASTTSAPNFTLANATATVQNSSLVYSATDASTNTVNDVLPVEVYRSEPLITIVGSANTVITNLGDAYTEQGIDIFDAQDGSISAVTASGTVTPTTAGNAVGGARDMTVTIDSSAVDVNTNGSYQVTYDVTDFDGNVAAQAVRNVTVGAWATDSNFTMLDKAGKVFGGTNDVVFDWPLANDVLSGADTSSLNTAESGTNFDMTIVSAGPHPFFAAIWVAHDVRLFGPGTYHFDTTCDVATLQTTGCPGMAGAPTTISMTVGAGQIGAHMLFDWNNNNNIDVLNVWEADGVWANPDGAATTVNDLWTGIAGNSPDPTTTWKLVSVDANGDGINGTKMVDGPFDGFYANFNAGPGASVPPPPPFSGTQPDTKLDKATLAFDWWILLGAPAVLGFFRRLANRKARS